jgi:hypothetical protein
MANAREGAAFSVNVNSRILIHVGDRYGRPPVFAHPSVCDEPLYCPGFRIGGGQGMIGEPKFWYGGMLQQAAAGRFLGYGGMRQTGVGDFTYAFTHHARARRGLETSIANSQSMSGASSCFPQTTKSCTTRQTFQNATPRQPKLGRGTAHQDTGRGQPGVCTFMLPGLSRPSLIPFKWKVAVRPSGVWGYALSGGHHTVHSVWGYA